MIELARLRDFLGRELLPHERDEQETAYPELVRLLGNEDPTGPLIHTHHQIARLTRLYTRLVEQLDASGPRPADLADLRRALYGLHAVLVLHFAQEEEFYLAFGEVDGATVGADLAHKLPGR